jgi:hypothetical protein
MHLLLPALLLCTCFEKPTEETLHAARLYGPFFESNKSGLKGEASYLAFTDRKKLDAVLRLVPPVGGRRAEPLPADAFEKSVVLAVIRRGTQTYRFSGKKVSSSGGVLTYSLTSEPDVKFGDTAMFATPFVVTVQKGKYRTVEFVENGKKVATVKLD